MVKRFTISLPDDLYAEVKASAERDCRTLSREIEYLLRLRSVTTISQSQFDNFKRTTPENPTGQTHTPTSHIGYKRTIID